jgi:HPt (histidine-containing phosphotransfer) domain-containing protein
MLMSEATKPLYSGERDSSRRGAPLSVTNFCGDLMTTIDITTFDELKQMSGDEFINELIDTFLEDAPKMIAELEAAFSANDADVFRRAAHSMKSNAATFGASELAALAKELEMLGKEKRLAETGDRLKHLAEAYEAVRTELARMKS